MVRKPELRSPDASHDRFDAARSSDAASEPGAVSSLRCPHCAATLTPQAAVGAVRCGECRLVVGPGRALSEERTAARPGVGAAAGHVAARARHTGADAVAPEQISAALRRVADDLGVRVEALRMVDYRRAATARLGSPTLAEVMATFGNWRSARNAAAGT